MSKVQHHEAPHCQQQAMPYWVAAYNINSRPEMRLSLLEKQLALSLPDMAQNQSCTVIFDGVLYNRVELLHELPGLHESNADIITRAYQRWGEGFLQHIKGIFALLIWDAEKEQLLAVRDPIGIYPLYYARVGPSIFFSTSVDQLLAQAQVPPTLNRAALADHLAHRWPVVDETFYAAIRRVRPGNLLRIHGSQQTQQRYWDPAPPEQTMRWVREDELEQFDELFIQAIKRLQDFGPAGIFLSGGLDSVSVAAMAVVNSRRGPYENPLALSLAFPGTAGKEEADIQRGVAEQLGIPQILMPFAEAAGAQGLLQSALAMSSAWPMPLLNTWNPAYVYLAQQGKAQNDCQVILTGTGGDEWLTVSVLLAADMMRQGNFKGLYQIWDSYRRSYRFSSLTVSHNILWKFGAHPLLVGIAGSIVKQKMPGLFYANRRRLVPGATPQWIAPDPILRKQIDQRVEQSMEAPFTDSFYMREMREALEHPLVNWEMEEVFETSRHLNTRIMTPFFDADLVDFLYRVPPALLDRNGRSKGLVRQTLANHFPGQGFERQKKFTGTNVYQDLLLKEGPRAWQYMGGVPALAELGIVEADSIKDSVHAILRHSQAGAAYRIWDVLNLEAWVRPRG